MAVHQPDGAVSHADALLEFFLLIRRVTDCVDHAKGHQQSRLHILEAVGELENMHPAKEWLLHWVRRCLMMHSGIH